MLERVLDFSCSVARIFGADFMVLMKDRDRYWCLLACEDGNY